MDVEYTIGGIFFITLGILTLVFHKNFTKYTTRFRENIVNVKHTEDNKNFNNIMIIYFGISSIIFGLMLLFRLTNLR